MRETGPANGLPSSQAQRLPRSPWHQPAGCALRAHTHAPQCFWKKASTCCLSTFLSMLATYTVRPHSSRSSGVRGRKWLLTGTMAVLEGSTRSGYAPTRAPFIVAIACQHHALTDHARDTTAGWCGLHIMLQTEKMLERICHSCGRCSTPQKVSCTPSARCLHGRTR